MIVTNALLVNNAINVSPLIKSGGFYLLSIYDGRFKIKHCLCCLDSVFLLVFWGIMRDMLGKKWYGYKFLDCGMEFDNKINNQNDSDERRKDGFT